MKNLLLFPALLMPLMGYAQDMIQLKDKSTLSVRVIIEDKESVEFIRSDDPGKTIKVIDSDEVKKIKYEKKSASVNVIKITHDSLENELYLNDVINHLIESGFMIESFDNKYYTVSTPLVKEERFTAEIVGNTANFRCFYFPPNSEDYPPRAAAQVVWGIKPEPGEKMGTPGSSAFKKLDALCRTYLRNGKSVMVYATEAAE